MAAAGSVRGAGARGAARVPHDELDAVADVLGAELAVARGRELSEAVKMLGAVHLAIVEAVRADPFLGGARGEAAAFHEDALYFAGVAGSE